MCAFLRVLVLPAIVLFFGLAPDGAARGQQAPPGAATPQPADAPAVAAKSLQFNFRRQPWDEVLQWLADEADLSLVLDAPPPGSFNYTDAKPYTTDEAIDLVNGVLASKGYSLLRRERMLMLINLQDAVPRTLVPRVTLGNVDQRGKNEFVTVAFPLEGRNAETALAEIQPLISQFGHASALPASGQLIVTDRAGLMRVIAAVLESIPKPAVAAVSAAAEQPVLRVYALEGADAAAAVEILQSVVEGKFVHDPGGDRINAYATLAQHLVIEQLMEQVRGAAGQKQFRLEIYPIEGLPVARQTQLIADLQMGAVNVPMRFDAANGQLVVWASDPQHFEIRKALLTLLAAGAGLRDQAAQVYQLEHADAADLLPLLQAAVPEARVIQGGAPHRILAIATRQEHQIMDQLLASLDRLEQRDPLTIREYRVEQDPPAELAALLAAAAPDASIRIDASRGSVVATGTAEDQRLVAEALEGVQGNLQPRLELDLAIYALSPLQHERFADVRASIEQTSPGARLVWNENAGELFVWAAPDDQTSIQRLLQSLGDTPRRPASQQFRAYPTPLSQLETMAAMIAQVTPQAVTTIDRPGRRLLVWADAEDHQQIGPILRAAPAAPAASTDPMSYHAYPAGVVDLILATRLLSDVFPAAEIQSDATARTIIAHATASDQREIEAMLRQFGEGNEHEVTAYPLGNVPPAQATGLGALFPLMRISVDPSANQIVAWGTGEDHRQFRDALNSLGGNQAAGAWHVQTFPLEKAQASEVAAALQQFVPGVTAAAVNDSQLLVRCRPDLEPRVTELISQLDVSRNRPASQQFRAYPTPLSQLETMAAMIAQVTPQAVTTIDRPGRRLLVWADAEDHQQIGPILRAAPAAPAASTDPMSYHAYPAGVVDLILATRLLSDVFPAAEIQSDATARTIIAHATASDQREIEAMLRQFGEGNEHEVTAYPLGNVPPAQATGLGALFPLMRISVDPSANQIVAWGTGEDHRQFRDALNSLGGNQAAGAWHVQTFPLEKAQASEVAAALQQFVPGVTAAAVNDSQLLVRCRPDLEPRVTELISQLDVSRTLHKRQNAQVFSLRFADPLALRTTLQALFPLAGGAHFSSDAQTRSMVAVADPDQMALIEEVIAAADRRGGADEGERLLRVHALDGVEGTMALQTLQELFEARGARPLLSVDRQRNRLVAVATPAEQEIVADILTSLAPPHTELEIFPLETMDLRTAQLAIGQLFGSVSTSDGLSVDVELDEDGGRILVRATPAQLAEIRSLLRQMGEEHLLAPGAGARTTRFIPWNVADQEQALEQLQATWRQLRPNELRITAAQTSPPLQKESVPAEGPPETTAPPAQDQTPSDPPPDREPTGAAQAAGELPTEAPTSTPPPVFLIASPEGVAIASEDGAALDQLAVLLRAYGRPAASAHSRFGVYPLENASAQRVATVLTDIYRQSGARIHFAADERINAVIAQGARGERREVEALLQTLDTAQTTDFFKPHEPVMLMLQHASAKQVHQQLITLYRTKLERGKRQPPIEIPPGADPEVVATLEQINASREGPLLSLEVDIDSNSLIVIAPRPLLEEIRKFVAQVDQQSAQSRVGVRIIPLEAVKGDEILRSLEKILTERR